MIGAVHLTGLWQIVFWGIIATAGMTTLLEGAQLLGFSRMSLPFLFGTFVTDRRDRAMVYGFLLYSAGGLLFAFFYAAGFYTVGISSWWLGTIMGLSSIVAPIIGGVIQQWAHWRISFWVLAGLCALLRVGALTLLRETLPPELRQRGGLGMTASRSCHRWCLDSFSARQSRFTERCAMIPCAAQPLLPKASPRADRARLQNLRAAMPIMMSQIPLETSSTPRKKPRTVNAETGK